MPQPSAEKAPVSITPLARAYSLLGTSMEAVENRLSEFYASPVHLIPEVSEHLIGSGGKRIRPVMLLMCAKAAGVNPDEGLDLAVACEMLHNATLLHDDVVDRGELRRGVASAPKVFGNSASVLVGDFLLSRSLGLIVNHGDLGLLEEYSRMLANMAEGEVLQLLRSGRLSVSLPEYVEIISGKTAGLFSWCCRAGASLVEGKPTLSHRAARFGKAFGMAFQVTDDILDYTSSPEQSGKDIANDLQQGKATLPLLLACIEDSKVQSLVDQAVHHPETDHGLYLEIVNRVLDSKSIVRSLQEARRYTESALEELENFEPGPAQSALSNLTGFIVDRVSLP